MDYTRYKVLPSNRFPGLFAVVEEIVYQDGRVRKGDEVEWSHEEWRAENMADRFNANKG